MGSKGSQVTQQQTYNPNPQAAGAISGALSQAQGVAQTPFNTPVAPVAGFSPDQQNAFQNTRNAQGQAQPYIDQAQDYFAGNHVNQFLNPYAANVMAGMKDLFGQQQQQTTGNLTQQAGGVGADRIAVGQSELVRQQQLAAGQTLAGLYQPALSASQNAGFGIGSLGPVAQNAALQGAQAQLGTGGLQQQLRQAQMNAPYQNQLAQIQWPYQNAQFNAGITASLAPGMGGTTSGNTTYPQQNPWGTVAGLGMAGLGAYGASGGGFGGVGNVAQGYNWDGSMSGNQWAAAGQGQGPYAAYAEGGAVDDDMGDQIRSAEIKELQDAGDFHGGNSSPLNTGVNARPIDVSAQSMIPNGQIPAIQPHIPQLQAPQQQGSGSGGIGDIAKAAATVLPFLLNRGGAVNPYAEGGSVKDYINPNNWIGRPEPVPEGEGFWQNFLKQNPFGTALMGLKPGAVRLAPTTHANPQLQLHGRFTRPQAHGAYLQHRAVGKWPLIASGQIAANAPRGEDPHAIPHDDSPMIERQNDAVTAGAMGKGLDTDSFADRFGGMAPPSPSQGETPLFMRSGLQEAPPSRPEHVPLPRSNPFVALAMEYEAKKQASLDPRGPQREAPPDMAPPYRPTRFADGGEVDEEMAPFTRRQAALDTTDPFERAALRTRESVRPTSGRKDGPLMGAAGTALAIAGSPEAMLTSYAPRVGAALYGLGAGTMATEAGEPTFKWSDPNADRARRLEKIEQEMALETSRKTPSAAGTQKARLDSLIAEKTGLLGTRDTEYKAAHQGWMDKQEEDRLAAVEKKNAETSLFDKIPGTRAAITALSPGVSYLGGKFLGKRLSPWASVPIGATTGAIEGAASIAGPTEMDINSLPRTSATRQEAEADLDKKSYWQRVALAAGVSGAAGALGATKGYAGTRPILTPKATALPDVVEKAAQVAKKKAAPIPVKLPDGSTVSKYDLGNGKVRWMQNGRFVKAPNLKAPTASAPMQMQAAGGRIHANPYAEGGSVDDDSSESWANVIARQNNTENPLRRMNAWGADYSKPGAPAAATPEPTGSFDPKRFGDWSTTQGAYGRKLSGDMTGTVPARDYADPQAPHEEESDDGALPPSASSTVGANPFSPPAAPGAPATNRRKDLVDSPWMALMQAGLGTMAAAGHRDAHGLPTQPFAAIGQGGMKGMETLREQQTAGMKQQSIDQAARKLEADALRYQRAMGETERRNDETQRHNRVMETRPNAAMAGRGDRWKAMGPTQDGKGTVFLNETTGQTKTEDVQAGPKTARPIPAGLQTKLGDSAQTFHRTSALKNSFEPSFADRTFESVGDMDNWIARQTKSGNKDMAAWWQDYQAYKSDVRHKLYGAALTANEIAEWRKQDINPGMDPEMIRRNLARQHEIIKDSLHRTGSSLSRQYDKNAVEDQIGVTLDDLKNKKYEGAAPAAPSRPAGIPAEAKSAPDGKWYVPDPKRPGKYLEVRP